MPYFVALIVGFIIGSVPSAFIVIKRALNLDITATGSGNVGARNAYDVSGSKRIGLLVLLLDLLKGIAATLIGATLIGGDFIAASLAGIGSVAGHNYSPWLKFKGGKGLATAAGVMLLLCWSYLITWIVLYFLINSRVKNIHISTVISTLLSTLSLLLLPAFALRSVIFPAPGRAEVVLLGLSITLLIISKHLDPIKVYFSKVSDRQK